MKNMNNSDYGVYGLLAGIEKASTDLSVPPSFIKQSISALASSSSRFQKKLKQRILEKSMKETTKSAAKYFGIPEYIIIDILKKYLIEEANTPGNSIYPYDTFDRFTQTYELPSKNWVHIASQTDIPYKVPKKSYTTLEKIQEIRKSLEGLSNAPANSIEKWKEKIRKMLFQDEHVLIYDSSKKNKFLWDIDGYVLEWYNNNKPNDQDFIKKCQEIAGFADVPLTVSLDWIKKFKSYHKLD